MGYLIKVNYFSLQQLRWLKVAGWLSLAVLILAAGFNVKHDLINSPFLFLYCVGLYITIKQITEKSTFFFNHQKLLAKLSSVSLGIYILHPLFYLWFKLLISVAPSGFIYIWIMPLVTYVVCGSIVYLMKKVKFIKTIMP